MRVAPTVGVREGLHVRRCVIAFKPSELLGEIYRRLELPEDAVRRAALACAVFHKAAQPLVHMGRVQVIQRQPAESSVVHCVLEEPRCAISRVGSLLGAQVGDVLPHGILHGPNLVNRAAVLRVLVLALHALE